MEIDERRMTVQPQLSNKLIVPPPPPPGNPPPPPPPPPLVRRDQHRPNREGRFAPSEIVTTTQVRHRVWRRRPDEEETQLPSHALVATLSPIREASERDLKSPTPSWTSHENDNNSTSIEIQTPVKNNGKDVMQSLEIDDGTPPITNSTPRFMHMSWRKHHYDPNGDGIGNGLSFGDASVEGLYYGDVMQSFSMEESGPIKPTTSGESTTGSKYSSTASKMYGKAQRIIRSLSHVTRSSSPNDDSSVDSLADFDESEWTPQDSAYGAACPICGCLPKKIRRGIELTLIGFVVFMLVYLVVTTSIRITNDHNDKVSSISSSPTSACDDDHYVANGCTVDDDDDVDDTNDNDANQVTYNDGEVDDAVDDANDNGGRWLRLVYSS